MSLFGLFVNAVHVSEVEDGFISNRRPMSDDQRKAIYAAGGGGGGGGKGFKKSVKPGKGGNNNKKFDPRDPHAGFYAAPNINEVRKKFPQAFDKNGKMKPGYSFGQISQGGRITSISHNGRSTRIGPLPTGGNSNVPRGSSPAAAPQSGTGTYSVYRPPVDVKDMQPWSADRDLARRVAEYEDRTGQRWPGPTTVDTMPPDVWGFERRIPIDPGGAIGRDSMGNPIFRGPNGNPVVYDQKTGGWRPPGLQMPATPANGPQLGGPGGPVKSVASIKRLSVEEAAARRNETRPGTIERLIAEQDLKVAMDRDRSLRQARGGVSELIAISDKPDNGFNPNPGYGTPPGQRGGIRTMEFRDRDGDGVDDRDQDGPGMPRYGRPGVGAPGLITTPGFRVPDQSGPPWGHIPPNLREPAQPRIPGQPTPGQGFKKGPDGRVVYDPGILPPSWRNSINPAPYVPSQYRYSSADQSWKYKMLAE